MGTLSTFLGFSGFRFLSLTSSLSKFKFVPGKKRDKLASTSNDNNCNRMEIDPSPGSSSGDLMALSHSGLPKIDENHVVESKRPKERILELLDVLESHVEKLRKEAVQLEEDRDQLLSSLDSVRNTDLIVELADNDRDDVCRYADRIMSRCLTVEVKILTQRDKMQEEALHQVNHLIDGLVMCVKSDPENAKARCVSYMNACSSNTVHGITDKKFESALLGCTLDDQKRVKKRLQGLLHYFDKLNVTSVQ